MRISQSQTTKTRMNGSHRIMVTQHRNGTWCPASFLLAMPIMVFWLAGCQNKTSERMRELPTLAIKACCLQVEWYCQNSGDLKWAMLPLATSVNLSNRNKMQFSRLAMQSEDSWIIISYSYHKVNDEYHEFLFPGYWRAEASAVVFCAHGQRQPDVGMEIVAPQLWCQL